MSRPILSLNHVETDLVDRISAALARERTIAPPKPKRAHKTGPDVVYLNGRRYVAQADTSSAQALFSNPIHKLKSGEGE